MPLSFYKLNEYTQTYTYMYMVLNYEIYKIYLMIIIIFLLSERDGY